MFTISRALALAVSVMLFFPNISPGQPVCENTYTGPSGGKWGNQDYWSLGVEPNASLVACIPHDKSVLLDGYGEAEAIWVMRSGEQQGSLRIKNDSAPAILVIHKDSTVDGVVQIDYRATLQVMGQLVNGSYRQKISGTGGRIEGTADGAAIQGRLGGDNGGTLLTFAPGPGGDATRATSIMVHGRLNIYTPIVNDKAFVVADHGLLHLAYDVDTRESEATKGGNWIAEQNPVTQTVGELRISVPVRGPGRWNLTSHPDAKISILSVSRRNSGPVTISKGKFWVGEEVSNNAEFITSGKLIFESVDGSEPVIKVFDGSFVQFDN